MSAKAGRRLGSTCKHSCKNHGIFYSFTTRKADAHSRRRARSMRAAPERCLAQGPPFAVEALVEGFAGGGDAAFGDFFFGGGGFEELVGAF